MAKEDLYEVGLPKYLKDDIERVIKGRKDKDLTTVMELNLKLYYQQ